MKIYAKKSRATMFLLVTFIMVLISCGSRNRDEISGDGFDPNPQPYGYEKDRLNYIGIIYDVKTNSAQLHLRTGPNYDRYTYAVGLKDNSFVADVVTEKDRTPRNLDTVSYACAAKDESGCLDFQLKGPPYPEQTIHLKKQTLSITHLQSGIITLQTIFKIKMPKLLERFGYNACYLWPANDTANFHIDSSQILLSDSEDSSILFDLYVPPRLPKALFFYTAKCDDVVMLAKTAKITCHFSDRQTGEVIEQTWLLKISL